MSSGVHVENFDTLALAGVNGWTNNLTLPGWYASRTAGTTVVTNYQAGDGSSIVGALYSFGSSGSSDRALGTLASGTPGNFAFGLRLINDTGFTRSNIVIAYMGEQWRAGGVLAQTLAVSYRVGAGLTNADARNEEAWMPVPALNFISPNTNATQTLNGNAATNRVACSNVIPGLVIAAGQELFLRWRDVDDAGYDDALAVDDLTVSFGDAISNAPPAVVLTNGSFSFVTYNVKGNFTSDWTTNAPQVQAIARKLNFLNPDIIALNEIPNGLRYEMTNWMTAFFPTYHLAVSPGTDGAIRNGVISRYSIKRSTSWLTRVGLTNFGYEGVFTRDLFEAEIAMPDFPQPLHVFVAHLKSGTDDADSAARRGAEALAISNFFVTGFLTTNALHPYLLAGDMNEDLAIPATGSHQPIQKLTDGTGLHLTTPVNPVTQQRFTHSIQIPGVLARRYDYVFPDLLLFANIRSAQVFRSDVLNPLPENLNVSDSATASDHLPVQMVFNNPFTQPFHITSIVRSNETVTLSWQSVPGQRYAVEVSVDVADTKAWDSLATDLLATNNIFHWQSIDAKPWEFFRVKHAD
jgi:endonuclease/exonuclease/phosphatase family metal-dependent hydrolase